MSVPLTTEEIEHARRLALVQSLIDDLDADYRELVDLAESLGVRR